MIAAVVFFAGAALAGAAVGWLAVGIALPFVVRRARAAREEKDVERLWPDALAFLASVLRAGMTVSQALDLLRAHADPRLRRVLKKREGAADEVHSVADRIACLFSDAALAPARAALRLAHASGGRGAASLNACADALRARFELEDEIRAASAHGRGTAWIVGATPFLFLLAAPAASPDVYGLLLEPGVGRWLTGSAVALIVCGVWMVHRLARVDA